MPKKVVKSAARKLKKKNKKLYYVIVTIVVLVVIGVLVYGYFNGYFDKPVKPQYGEAGITVSETAYENAAGNLAVHFMDVGQGDGIYIEFPSGKDMLIDGGETPVNNDGAMLEYLKEVNDDNKIDYLLVTHADADHCNKLVSVIEYFEIGTFYLPYATLPDYSVTTATADEIAMFEGGKGIDTATFRNLLISVFNEENSTVNVVAGNFNITVEDAVTFLVYSLDKAEYAEKGAKSNVNEQSPICILAYQNRRIVLTGDAEKKSEADYLEDSPTLDCDVLKVGHHGSDSSSTTAFLADISCEYAVISVGLDNTYGHPHKVTLDALSTYSMTVFTTIDYGNIVAVVSVNGELSFFAEKLPSAETSA